MGAETTQIDAVRSFFTFYAFVASYDDPTAKQKLGDLQDKWHVEFIGEVVDLLSEMQNPEDKDGHPSKLRVLFGGDGFEGYEAMAAVKSDLMYAVGSYLWVIAYATLH